MRSPLEPPEQAVVRDRIPDLREIALIGLAWLLLIGVIVFPVAQLIGIVACAVALAAGKARSDGSAPEQIQVRDEARPFEIGS